MHLKYIVNEESNGKTIKQILKNHMDVSERLIKKLKYNKQIFCNSIPVYVNVHAFCGDIIDAYINFIDSIEGIIPENIDLDIIYEDKYLIAINKHPGIVVHPTSTHTSGTIANALAYYYNSKGLTKKIRPVSRLDRDTSGIIIFAKNEYIQELLIRQMKSKVFFKEYIGVIQGVLKEKTGTIDLPIDRKPGSIMLRHISESGRPSVTRFNVERNLSNHSIVKFVLETGRTHQIRVHCLAIGHPLVGDSLYSEACPELIGRQALHACRIRFVHPYSKELIELSTPIPSDMQLLISKLEK